MADETSGIKTGGDKELSGEITSKDTQPETTGKPSLKEAVETVEISTMTPNKTEYTK